MKSIYIQLLFSIFLTQFALAQDSLFIGNDTAVCTNGGFIVSGNLPDSVYSYLWSTLDTTDFITVDSTGIYNAAAIKIDVDTFLDINMMDSIVIDTTILFDTIFIEIKSVPIPQFSVDPVCFGDSSIIVNTSQYMQDSTVVYVIENYGVVSDTSKEITLFIDENNTLRNVIASIYQHNGCSVIDTFVINIKQKPIAAFDTDHTCENENLILINQSSDVTTAAVNSAFLSGANVGMSNNDDNINLGIIGADTFIFEIIVDNQNECTDTTSLRVEIFPVTEVSFTGLAADLEYCVFDPPSTLTGSESGGMFSGQNVSNSGGGVASFNPITVDTNILISYSYTNTFGCTDIETQTVAYVHPLPMVSFIGLDPEYCVFDSASLIIGNQSGGVFNSISILSQITSTTYDFNPELVGTYNLIYSFIDQNGCENETTQSTIVHPLPLIDLPAQVNLGIGQTVTIGDPNPGANVIYEWSNGKTSNTIDVNLPGIYVVNAVDTITTCMASDTIIVKLATSTRDLLSAFNLYPNPVYENLTIDFDAAYKGSVSIYDMVGNRVYYSQINTPILKYSIRTDFPTGLYFIRFENIGSVVINKL